MGEAEPKGRDHYRGKARVGRRIELSYALVDDADKPQRVFTKNIGVGGAFLLTTDPQPPGTKLTITLEAPSRPGPLTLAGEVRWIVDGKHDEPESQHGMGVKFSGIPIGDLMLLNEYFSSLPESIDID